MENECPNLKFICLNVISQYIRGLYAILLHRLYLIRSRDTQRVTKIRSVNDVKGQSKKTANCNHQLPTYLPTSKNSQFFDTLIPNSYSFQANLRSVLPFSDGSGLTIAQFNLMDELPAHVILDILGRLDDSFDVARLRICSKTFNSLASELKFVKFHSSYARYVNSRSGSQVTPFKSVFNKLIDGQPTVESVSIGVDRPPCFFEFDDVEDEEADNLFLTDVGFVSEWLPKVCGGLRKLSVSDFWVQSCWRRSYVLQLLASHCSQLLDLEIRNAWLSVDGLTPMPNLTILTLEFIRLDDENLDKMNECFPYLKTLNLIGVGGLKEPRIHLMHLETCRWRLSNAPISISIIAPSLIKLTLDCVKPDLLLIDATSLLELSLSLLSSANFTVKGFTHLKTLNLESPYLRNLLASFPFKKSVDKLTVCSTRWERPNLVSKPILELLLGAITSVESLTLTSGAWSEFESYPGLEGLESGTHAKGLKEIRAYLTVNDIEATLSAIHSLLDYFVGLSSVELFVHRDVVGNVTGRLMSRCMAHRNKVRWRWGLWKEGIIDAYISDAF